MNQEDELRVCVVMTQEESGTFDLEAVSKAVPVILREFENESRERLKVVIE
jgi:hypothetical protein